MKKEKSFSVPCVGFKCKPCVSVTELRRDCQRTSTKVGLDSHLSQDGADVDIMRELSPSC